MEKLRKSLFCKKIWVKKKNQDTLGEVWDVNPLSESQSYSTFMSKHSQLTSPSTSQMQLKSSSSFSSTSAAEVNVLGYYRKEATPHLSLILDV